MSTAQVSTPESAAPVDTRPAVTTTPPDASASSVTVTVRYFAAARAAAGIDEESVPVTAPATVDAVVAAAVARHGQALQAVLTRCSYLLDATAVHDTSVPVRPGAQLDVLPPFAGG